jgi:hypothetical protein
MKKTRPDWSGILLGSKLEPDIAERLREGLAAGTVMTWLKLMEWEETGFYLHLPSRRNSRLHHPVTVTTSNKKRWLLMELVERTRTVEEGLSFGTGNTSMFRAEVLFFDLAGN